MIVKDKDKYYIVSGIDKYIYIANRIIDLEDFNNFFNQNRLRFTIKIIIIIAFFIIMYKCMKYL